ncbi:Rap1a/Tai family immunity protein [Pseudophaeobacter sp.]|uniref:Rap1a/Tai family immunity protein n=1 Tax=Pseudophaeobacter sp. TaxID=1971739 RepID=UPI003A980F38
MIPVLKAAFEREHRHCDERKNVRPIQMIAIGLLAASPSMSAALSTGEAYNACQLAAAQNWERGSSSLCLGLIIGVSGMAMMNCQTARSGAAPSDILSAEGGHSYAATTQAFLNWARDNPQNWEWPAANGVAVALSRTFPCKAIVSP